MDKRTKIVFCDTDNVHLALGIFSGIRGMRGVHHDRLAELAPDRSERRLRGISRAKNLADPAHRIDPLIHDCDAFLCAGQRTLLRRTLAGTRAGHELDDGFPAVAAGDGTDQFAELAFRSGVHGNAKFLFDGETRALAAGFPQLVHDDAQNGSVELLGLRHAHIVDLEPNDRQAGAREKVDRRLRAGRWEIRKLSGLTRTSVFSTFSPAGYGMQSSSIPPSESEYFAQMARCFRAVSASCAASTAGSK